MEKITFKNILSASIHADNSSDGDRLYDIQGDANVSNGKVSSIYNGSLSAEDGTFSASFYKDGGSFQFNISGSTTAAQKVALLEAVSAFCDAVMASSVNVSLG